PGGPTKKTSAAAGHHRLPPSRPRELGPSRRTIDRWSPPPTRSLEELPDRAEESFLRIAPGRERSRSAFRPGRESLPQAGVTADRMERRSEPAKITGLGHERFAAVLGEVRQVRGPPADHGQPRRDRFCPRRPV